MKKKLNCFLVRFAEEKLNSVMMVIGDMSIVRLVFAGQMMPIRGVTKTGKNPQPTTGTIEFTDENNFSMFVDSFYPVRHCVAFRIRENRKREVLLLHVACSCCTFVWDNSAASFLLLLNVR